MTDRDWDLHLGIHTTGREDYAADTHHYAYEPTPYCVLERLAASGDIDSSEVIALEDHLNEVLRLLRIALTCLLLALIALLLK